MWFVYILQCGDGTLYTGIATNVEARLEKHRSGKGAKYTRGRGELELVYQDVAGSKSDATKRERAIKAMKRDAKLELIGQGKSPTSEHPG